MSLELVFNLSNLASKSKNNKAVWMNICFSLLIFFSPNIPSHLHLFQWCCIISTKSIIQISIRRHFAWAMIVRQQWNYRHSRTWNSLPGREPNPTPMHKPQPPASMLVTAASSFEYFQGWRHFTLSLGNLFHCLTNLAE